MSFIRPELAAQLRRWREALQGVAVAVLGLWVFFVLAGFAALLGLVLAALGLILVWTGILRARFRRVREGPGVVEIVERRLTYFAPEGGFSLSLDDVTRIEFDPAAPGWLFHLQGGHIAHVPSAAAEAERILDILPSFPGARLDAAAAASRSIGRERRLIWQKED